MHINFKWLAVLLISMLVAFAGCEVDDESSDAKSDATSSGSDSSGSTSGAQTSATVTISTAGFNPKVATISRGGTVTFVNNDDQDQSLLFDDGSASLSLTKGSSGTKTFNVTTGYRSEFKSADTNFQGTITVQ